MPPIPSWHSVRAHVARTAAAALIAGSLVAGCSPSSQPPHPDPAPPAEDTAPAQAPAPPSDPTPAPAPTPTAPTASRGETVGGDGSEIRLDPLTESDLKEADLPGELACSFSVGDEGPILYAAGDVDSDVGAQGIVKGSGYVERVGAPGGFDGLLDNPTLSGRGKTILIALTGPAEGGGESPSRPATLTYHRADGASRVFEGRWECGP